MNAIKMTPSTSSFLPTLSSLFRINLSGFHLFTICLIDLQLNIFDLRTVTSRMVVISRMIDLLLQSFINAILLDPSHHLLIRSFSIWSSMLWNWNPSKTYVIECICCKALNMKHEDCLHLFPDCSFAQNIKFCQLQFISLCSFLSGLKKKAEATQEHITQLTKN